MLFLPTDHSPAFPARLHSCSQSHSPLWCTITEQQHIHTIWFNERKRMSCLSLQASWQMKKMDSFLQIGSALWRLPRLTGGGGGTCVYAPMQELTGSKLSSYCWFLIIILEFFFSYCIFAVCLVSSAWIKLLIPQRYAATTRSRTTPLINVLVNLFITTENSDQNIVLRNDLSHVSIPVLRGVGNEELDWWLTPICLFLLKWWWFHLMLIKEKSQGSPQWWPCKLSNAHGWGW